MQHFDFLPPLTLNKQLASNFSPKKTATMKEEDYKVVETQLEEEGKITTLAVSESYVSFVSVTDRCSLRGLVSISERAGSWIRL